jgi:hypothetical protein
MLCIVSVMAEIESNVNESTWSVVAFGGTLFGRRMIEKKFAVFKKTFKTFWNSSNLTSMSFRERLRSSPVCRLVGLPLDLNQVHELSSVLLADVPSLTHLRLEENDIHADGVVALAAALRNSPAGQPTRLHALRTLYISNQPLGDEGAVHLASILQENSVLTWVNFQANQIGAAGATALAEALKSNTTCTQVCLIY